MRIFQVDPKMKKGVVVGYGVLIINNEKQYTDTLDNFELDSKTLFTRQYYMYNDDLGHYVVNDKFEEYPNETMNNLIDNIDIYLQAQAERTYIPPVEPTLEELKTTKIFEMKAERNLREQQDIEYNNKLFDYDELSRERLSLAHQALEDNQETTSILWTCADNSFMELTLEDFKNINTLSATRLSNLHATYNKLKVLINNCTTKEEVQKITFDTDTSKISYGGD